MNIRTQSFDPGAPVALAICREYDPNALCAHIPALLEKIGVTRAFFSGKSVVIKPNLVMKKPAEHAATTHPAVLSALLSYLDSCDCREVVIAESMGGPYTEPALRAVYRVCGIEDAVRNHNARLNFDISSEPLAAQHGHVCKTFEIITPIAQADVVINLCKLKSHSLTRMSGAIKNTFGCIPGLTKFEFHARFPDYADFNRMIVDLSAMLHAHADMIDLCDAIVGMEGNGPTGGTPRTIGCLLASRNPFALDCAGEVLLNCIGEVPMVNEARSRGFAPAEASDLHIIGGNLKELAVCDFAPPDTARKSKNPLHWLPNLFGGKIYGWFAPRPVIRLSTCIGCGECERSCPVHTIEMRIDQKGKKKAYIKPDACIRCFCCQELCPIHSVDIRRNGILERLASARR